MASESETSKRPSHDKPEAMTPTAASDLNARSQVASAKINSSTLKKSWNVIKEKQ